MVLPEVRFLARVESVCCVPHAAPCFLFFLQDLLDSDWASVRKVLEQADILVIKYSVTDKLAFQQVRNGFAPRLRPLLRHWGVPVILVAVGARLNGENVALSFSSALCEQNTNISVLQPLTFMFDAIRTMPCFDGISV